MELRYSPDQPRDDHGRFGDASGSGDKYNPNSKELKKEIRILKSGISAGTAEKINDAAKAGDGIHPIVNAIRHETTQGQDVYRGVKAKANDQSQRRLLAIAFKFFRHHLVSIRAWLNGSLFHFWQQIQSRMNSLGTINRLSCTLKASQMALF